MIRLLLLAIFCFLLYAIWTALRSIVGSNRQDHPEERPEKSVGGEEMVQDPVCGTYVPTSDAVCARIGGKRICFCSEECRDTYRSGKR
ncbi:MAG: YHS domain-containing protein [Geothermobacteraceae bacterium]